MPERTDGRRYRWASAAAALLSVAGSFAFAQPVPSPKPAPYSLPWLLRPALPATVVRLDETLAFFEDPASGTSGGTYVTSLIASYKLGARWAPLFRQTWVHNSAPPGGQDPSGSGFSNPLLGVNYAHPFGGGWRWTGFFATTLPVGSGGGDAPDAGAAAGHFFSPRVSFGGELRVQRWLTNAAPVRSDARAREQFTLGAGPRFHFKVGTSSWIRPGLSYTRALDQPMSGKGYDILQIDVPVSF